MLLNAATTGLMDDELSFCRMVLIDNRDDRIPSCGIHLVSSVAVYFNLNEIGILEDVYKRQLYLLYLCGIGNLKADISGA